MEYYCCQLLHMFYWRFTFKGKISIFYKPIYNSLWNDASLSKIRRAKSSYINNWVNKRKSLANLIIVASLRQHMPQNDDNTSVSEGGYVHWFGYPLNEANPLLRIHELGPMYTDKFTLTKLVL